MPYKGKPTLYEQWEKIKDRDDIAKMKFYFKNSLAYKSYKIRKTAMGLSVYSTYEKFYAEMPNPQHNIILLYPDAKSPVKGEIVLDEFINSMKRTHDLLVD